MGCTQGKTTPAPRKTSTVSHNVANPSPSTSAPAPSYALEVSPQRSFCTERSGGSFVTGVASSSAYGTAHADSVHFAPVQPEREKDAVLKDTVPQKDRVVRRGVGLPTIVAPDHLGVSGNRLSLNLSCTVCSSIGYMSAESVAQSESDEVYDCPELGDTQEFAENAASPAGMYSDSDICFE